MLQVNVQPLRVHTLYHDNKPYTVYKMQLSTGTQSWSIARRYSEMSKFHNVLMRFLKQLDVYSWLHQLRSLLHQVFPKKGFGIVTYQVIRTRSKKLVQYIQFVLLLRRRALIPVDEEHLPTLVALIDLIDMHLSLPNDIDALVDECSICLDGIPSIKRHELPCGHEFHHNCITQWISEHATCPLCRKSCLKT
ncbi:hypothetical protein THRCLA_03292 [Thraustotheca clavata]|uniref:RING-type domain-containing protein n=1 Tax=Thraustotheca clavata TaxID=74557 RepID=A0A1W0A355_9STRA|nr:hypothetical protein THRCLA_03292 [Thraustotheca clavata]